MEHTGMFGDAEFIANPTKIEYSKVDFKHFSCRAVVLEGKQIGEYHVRPADNQSINDLMNRLRDIDTSEVGLIDSTGSLNLEFPIYVKVGGILAQETFFDTLGEIDIKL